MNPTGIDYLDLTWNPLAMRCTPASPGCAHCWHLKMARRKAANGTLSATERLASEGTVPPMLLNYRLWEPLERRKPAVIGVQFMGDLFHEAVSDLDIYNIFAVMAEAAQHTFMVLTKRSERLLDFCRRLNYLTPEDLPHLTRPSCSYNPNGPVDDPHPLPNVWLGISAENQEWFDRRWHYLRQAPAAKIFLSYEPGLGPIDLPEDFLHRGNDAWGIAGGESGPGARPMHPEWVRNLRDQCQDAGVPFFFKSWGEFGPEQVKSVRYTNVYAHMAEMEDPYPMYRGGKKAAGRLLDGREWNEVPK